MPLATELSAPVLLQSQTKLMVKVNSENYIRLFVKGIKFHLPSAEDGKKNTVRKPWGCKKTNKQKKAFNDLSSAMGSSDYFSCCFPVLNHQ